MTEDKLFDDIIASQHKDSDFIEEEFKDPFSDKWNFSVFLYILVPYGPGTPDCKNLNEEATIEIRKNIERVLPMMTCFKHVSNVISFDEKLYKDKLTTMMKFKLEDGFHYLLKPYHIYMFSFDDNFKTIGNHFEFVNLLLKATYKTRAWIDLLFNKGDESLYHQCKRRFDIDYISINTLISDINKYSGITNFIKNVKNYGTYQI